MGCKIFSKNTYLADDVNHILDPEAQPNLEADECFFVKILRRFLNLSLFIKIGAIIGLCFLGYVVMTAYFYIQLSLVGKGMEQLGRVYLPQYKVGQLAIRHLQEVERIGNDILASDEGVSPLIVNKNKLLLRQSLKGGIIALSSAINGGQVRDVSRFGNILLDEFYVPPVKDPAVRTHAAKALDGFEALRRLFERYFKVNTPAAVDPAQRERFALDFRRLLEGTDEEVSSIIRISSEQNLYNLDRISSIMQTGRLSGIAVAVFLIWVLAVAGYLFIQLVLKPIREITLRINRLANGQEERHNTALDIKTSDEIGLLAQEFNRLLSQINEFNAFKKIIEEDETVEEIYQRLAEIFEKKLELKTFAIFQVSNSENKMKPVYLSPPDLEFNPEKLADANMCRAKRTGHIISSIEYPGICRLFCWKNEVDHICIPMVVGGRTVGVVQFLVPVSNETKVLHNINFTIRQAQSYIREAIPVIEAKRFAQSLKEMALKDALTDLYNRRFLESYIDTMVAGTLRRNAVLSILMCDIDYFKEVNDNYGHEVGDEVLKLTAKILKENIRASDMIVRFGGEEFLILLTDTQKGDACKVAEKLRKLISQAKFKIPGGHIQKTISIGVSEFPVDSEAIWETIKFADVALYEAKKAGRNQVARFSPEMWPHSSY